MRKRGREREREREGESAKERGRVSRCGWALTRCAGSAAESRARRRSSACRTCAERHELISVNTCDVSARRGESRGAPSGGELEPLPRPPRPM